ncbi:MAG: glycosyltransferase [Chitinophagaceae bacterium]|nr:glycosyltransferase [Chitinophagaceae bacterium]
MAIQQTVLKHHQKIIILGPAHPLRGGLATFNQRLAKEFTSLGHDCSIYSFSLQYPSLLFPGKSQFTDDPAPKDITIRSVINSINPLNWINVGRRLQKERADIIIVRFWLPFMGPALGTILRYARKNKQTKVICIADNVIPHEKRPGDKPFTKYFLKACDAFVTMSEKVMQDLRLYEKEKPAKLVHHPLYDTFGDIIDRKDARAYLGLPENGRILLFFGFIRKYKGLDLLFEAMAMLKTMNVEGMNETKLLVAGEFYEDEKVYQDQIDRLGIRDQLILRTSFIPDSEVKYFVCAADAVVQPYRQATQSGVTPLAYYFEKPMIVTNVGGLPSLVPHGKVGLVTTPDPPSIANAISEFYQLGEDYFIPHLRSEKMKYSWAHLVNTITGLVEEVR